MAIPALTQSLAAEGVSKIIVISEDPTRWRRAPLFSITKLWPRQKYVDALRELEATPGVTVPCWSMTSSVPQKSVASGSAGFRPSPTSFAVINEEVCEGCGNCGEVSNCLSLHAVETEFGPKTRIHQSSCNKDYACLDGDCPSFVTVEVLQAPASPCLTSSSPGGHGGARARTQGAIHGSYAIYIPGVGGTGVVTVNALLCYAALWKAKRCSLWTKPGLAQKGGAVLSNVVLTEGDTIAANKVAWVRWTCIWRSTRWAASRR